MGFKEAAVLAPVSFCLGILFICLTVDQKLLWGELTEETINNGFQFYTTFFNAPLAIKGLLHSMMGFGMLGLVVKLHKWDDSAMYFDGSSLVAYVFGLCVYLTVTVPGLQTIVEPAEGDEEVAARLDALRILSAGNILIMFCLGGILVLQAGQEYASRAEATARAEAQKEQRKEKKTL